MLSLYFAGGGTGNSPSATFAHLSPSSINITGISSTMGYLRPQSLQMNHASLCNLSSPPVVRTQLGQRKISMSVSLIIHSPFPHNRKFYHVCTAHRVERRGCLASPQMR